MAGRRPEKLDGGGLVFSDHVSPSSPEVSSATSGLTGQAEGFAPAALASAGERIAFRVSGSTISARRVAPVAGPESVVADGVPYFVTWSSGQRVDVSSSGRGYTSGRLVIRPKAGSLEVVLDSLTMDEYLGGLGEVPTSWPTAALEAQAIAGRTYAAYRLAHPQSTTFDIYSSVIDQAFVGADHTSGPTGGRWLGAVASTTGAVLTFGGAVIQAFYASSNGGASEDSGYVWATSLPYLRAVVDPFDAAAGNPNASWTETYSGEELGAWLTSAGRGNVGTVTGVSITGNVGASGRVDKATIQITGTTGTAQMTGNQFRSAVNAGAPSSRDLLSTRFSVTGAPAGPPPGRSPFGQLQFTVPYGANWAIVAGWVVDGDTPRDASTLHVYVDGKHVTTGTAGISWPTLAANEAFGSDHGFFIGVEAPGSTANVCVYAIDAGPFLGNRLLGCGVIDRRAKASPSKRNSAKAKRSTRRSARRRR